MPGIVPVVLDRDDLWSPDILCELVQKGLMKLDDVHLLRRLGVSGPASPARPDFGSNGIGRDQRQDVMFLMNCSGSKDSG